MAYGDYELHILSQLDDERYLTACGEVIDRASLINKQFAGWVDLPGPMIQPEPVTAARATVAQLLARAEHCNRCAAALARDGRIPATWRLDPETHTWVDTAA